MPGEADRGSRGSALMKNVDLEFLIWHLNSGAPFGENRRGGGNISEAMLCESLEL